MSANRIGLCQLATRIQSGDVAATGVFVRELERHLARMIRRHVRLGRPASEVDQQIAAAMGQLLGNDLCRRSPNRTVLIEEATRWICRATLEAIQSGHNAMETVPDR